MLVTEAGEHLHDSQQMLFCFQTEFRAQNVYNLRNSERGAIFSEHEHEHEHEHV